MSERKRYCIDCNTDISNRGNRTSRCPKCQEKHRKTYKKDKRKEYYDIENYDKARLRQKKRATIGYRRKPQLGSPNPWFIHDYGCGKNYGHDYAKFRSGKYKKPTWGRFWEYKYGMGETVFRDKYTSAQFNTGIDEEKGYIASYRGENVRDSDTNKRLSEIAWKTKKTYKISPERIREYDELFKYDMEQLDVDYGDLLDYIPKDFKERRNKRYKKWKYWGQQ